MEGLADKVAIVTGGATILGAAVVRAFADAGARVVIADIDDQGGLAVADRLGDGVTFVSTDITSDAAIEACVETTLQTYGGIDFLVNLACSYVDDGLDSTRPDWLLSYDVNVVGGVMMARACRPHMVARGGGAVVNFASISGKVAQAGRWLYPATKAALIQVTRSLALDLAADSIRVNSVSPGWTWSKVMDELSEGDRAHTDAVGGDFHMLGRVGDPEEIADAVLFLCSPQASFVTGADLAVDGGYAALGPERTEAAIPRLSKQQAPPDGGSQQPQRKDSR